MAINLDTTKIDKKIIDLIYDKQNVFKKEKGRHVSIESTVCRLLKEAYLLDECGGLRKPGDDLPAIDQREKI